MRQPRCPISRTSASSHSERTRHMRGTPSVMHCLRIVACEATPWRKTRPARVSSRPHLPRGIRARGCTRMHAALAHPADGTVPRVRGLERVHVALLDSFSSVGEEVKRFRELSPGTPASRAWQNTVVAAIGWQLAALEQLQGSERLRWCCHHALTSGIGTSTRPTCRAYSHWRQTEISSAR